MRLLRLRSCFVDMAALRESFVILAPGSSIQTFKRKKVRRILSLAARAGHFLTGIDNARAKTLSFRAVVAKIIRVFVPAPGGAAYVPTGF